MGGWDIGIGRERKREKEPEGQRGGRFFYFVQHRGHTLPGNAATPDRPPGEQGPPRGCTVDADGPSSDLRRPLPSCVTLGMDFTFRSLRFPIWKRGQSSPSWAVVKVKALACVK